MRDELEHLEHVVLLEEGDGGSSDGLTMKALLDAAPAPEGASAGEGSEGEVDLDDVTCLLFTSGTTGLPKTVQLTHRNVTTNAVQVAHAHGLDDRSVMLNYLPTFHPMHLTAGIHARAMHVLCASPDAADSMVVAERTGVTHYYSLPVRLARLTVDPRLAKFDVPSLQLIASGGSSLSPLSATALAEHFGVPVIQGYGLAETSPLTHSDIPDNWKPGSVGPPVADTECRIVEINSREVLETGQSGEVQVRGPQVMKGYLGDETGTAIDADGWFSTGDVGYEDDDGYLFLVDRIKDVFKCDNWLVSPTEIERVVAGHSAISECVVVGLPDEFRGAVPFAFLVLANRDAGRNAAEEAMDAVNGQLAYYQQIKHFELLTSIPRGPTGKVSRAELRAAASRGPTEVQRS
jgi:long-chain acyl-CoA synthetase